MSAKTAVALPGDTDQFRDIEESIALRLRQRRNMLGLTQQQLAELIGVSLSQAKKYEAGTSRLSAARLYHIARALGVDVNYFFEGAHHGRPRTENLRPAQRRLLDLARDFTSLSPRDQELLSSLARSLISPSKPFITGKNLEHLLILWRMTLDDLARMMGLNDSSQLRLFLSGHSFAVTTDSMHRAKCLFDINECITRLTPTAEEQRKLLHAPQRGLANRSIFSLLLAGSMEDIIRAKEFATQLHKEHHVYDVREQFTGGVYVGKSTLQQAQNLSKRIVNLLESIGYVVELDDYSPGSWRQRFVARIKNGLNSHQVRENTKIVGDILYGAASVDVDVKIVTCVAGLTAAFADVDDVVVDAGPFLFVKISSTRKRKSIFVKRLTLEDRVIINGNPDLLNRPREILLRLKQFKTIGIDKNQEHVEAQLPQIPFAADFRD